MSAELLAAIDKVEADDLGGLCCPEFYDGGDITSQPEISNRQLHNLRTVQARLHRFERLPHSVVAAVQGLCFDGGLEPAVRVDMIAGIPLARPAAVRDR